MHQRCVLRLSRRNRCRWPGAENDKGDPPVTQWIFGLGGLVWGFWVGWHLVEGFQRRFEPPDAGIPGWHFWVVGILLFGSAIIGSVIGLATHELIFEHHRY